MPTLKNRVRIDPPRSTHRTHLKGPDGRPACHLGTKWQGKRMDVSSVDTAGPISCLRCLNH